MEDKQTNMIRQIMQNEVTWVIMIISAVLGFVSQVILPLQGIQLQLAHIQSDIVISRDKIEKQEKDQNLTNSRLDILETKVNKTINKYLQEE